MPSLNWTPSHESRQHWLPRPCGDRVWYSFEPEESTIRWVVEAVGEERFVYASDYAHWDCTSPDSARLVWERPDLTDAVKRKLLSDNATRLFNLKIPTTA